jgi:SAM-dependent methyltransferase
MKLHLGCGHVIKKGWVNVDIVKLPGVDKVFDLNKTPYPFKANTFEEVEVHHTLEHLDDLMAVMEELHRICKPGAIIRVSVPYFASPAFWRDPTHKRPFTFETFTYFNEGCYYSKAHFSILKRKLFYFSCRSFMKSRWYSVPFDFLINLAPVIYERFFVYLLPASELHIILQKPTLAAVRR